MANQVPEMHQFQRLLIAVDSRGISPVGRRHYDHMHCDFMSDVCTDNDTVV